MDIKLNQQIISNVCNETSMKRGRSIYKANGVKMEVYEDRQAEAIVSPGKTGDFYVVVKKDETYSNGFYTSCNCPTLTSVTKECQHVSAVLWFLLESEKKPRKKNREQIFKNDFSEIFDQKESRSSREQFHFENRTVLNIELICKPVEVQIHQYVIGMEFRVEGILVEDIRFFLKLVQDGRAGQVNPAFAYDPGEHCFSARTHAVLQELILILTDEAFSTRTIAGSLDYPERMQIPPSYWQHLSDLLAHHSHVKIKYPGRSYDHLSLVENVIPLEFSLFETSTEGYVLSIRGLNKLYLLSAYQAVLQEGTIIQLTESAHNRMVELYELLGERVAKKVSIPSSQISEFLTKIVPKLKELGSVHVHEAILKKVKDIPLVAKLYLDRVKGRLLAGIEFEYEGVAINPLEENLHQTNYVLRDVAIEEKILGFMESSSFLKTESGYVINDESLEYEFLYHVVPELQEYMHIYATTAVKNRIFKEKKTPKIRVKYKKERTNWLEFEFKVDDVLNDHIAEILEALEEKRKFFKLPNGSFLSLETNEYEALQQFLKEVPVQDDGVEDGFNVPIIQGLKLLDCTDEDVFSWEKSFRDFLYEIENPKVTDFPAPDSLQEVLRDYQLVGFRWMKRLHAHEFGGILADDMGLGKTLQAIAFIQSELEAIRCEKKPILIICPSSLTYNWLSEFHKFSQEINVGIVDGQRTKRLHTLNTWMKEKDVIITSYPLLRADTREYEKLEFHTVFFDEAQAFKNPFTQTAKAVRSLKATGRFALTGTPIENSREELWSIFRVVFPDLLGGLQAYNFLPREKIARRIKPFMLRRMKTDVLAELPTKTTTEIYSELLPEQKELYAAYLAKLRHDTFKHLDKENIQKNKVRILAGLTRLRQICCHPGLFVDGYEGESAKFNQLMSLLDEAKSTGRRVLVFSQFTKMLKRIGSKLTTQEKPYFYIDGNTSSMERLARCDLFNEGERDVFLISLKAGGTGLNLTGADTVILYDLWWNPAVEEQAADRAYRIGQQKNVQVMKLIAKGTIEEKMMELQEKKRNLIGELIDQDGIKQPSLTVEEIVEILQED